jgi:hypothetical protein
MPEMYHNWAKGKMKRRGLQYCCNTDPYHFYSTPERIGSLEHRKDGAEPKMAEERFEIAAHML